MGNLLTSLSDLLGSRGERGVIALVMRGGGGRSFILGWQWCSRRCTRGHVVFGCQCLLFAVIFVGTGGVLAL